MDNGIFMSFPALQQNPLVTSCTLIETQAATETINAVSAAKWMLGFISS